MTFITETSHLQTTITPESSRFHTYCSFIKEAFSKGFIQPYEEKLAQQSRHDWSRETWWQRLKDFANGKGVDSPKNLTNLVSCYLFAVAVSDDKDPTQKEQIFKECLAALDTKCLINTYYFCVCPSSPAAMSLALLRYFSLSDWQESLQLLFKHSQYSEFEKPLVAIIKEVSTNRWSPQEKEAFLDTLFTRLPQDRADDLYCNIVLYTKADELTHFRAACSPVLAGRLQAITEEIDAYIQKTIQDLAITPKCHPIAYNKKSNKRCLFIAQFFAIHRDCAVKDLIAADFEEEDWLWLNDQATSKDRFGKQVRVCPFAMSCLLATAERLSNGTLIAEERNGHHDPHLWLFFNYATKFINKNKERSDVTDGDYKRLALLLPPEILSEYFDAFDGEFENALMKLFIAQEPAKIVQWMQLLSQKENEWHTTASQKMATLFNKVIAHAGLETLISHIYRPETNDSFQVSAFAAAPEAARTAIIKAVFNDREEGMRTIEKWVCLSAPRQANASSIEALRILFERLGLSPQAGVKPFAREALTTHLYKVILTHDASLVPELRKRLSTTFKADEQALEFVDVLFPVSLNLTDPESRFNNALKTLKRRFETPHIQHRDREQLVRSLYQDLKGDLSKAAFIAKLFDALPPQSWPLVFLHFEHDIAGLGYMAYYEEKSGGGSFKRTNKDAPAKLGPKAADTKIHDFAQQKAETLMTKLASDEKPRVGDLQDLLLWDQLGQIEEAFAEPQETTFTDEERWITVAATALTHMIDNPCLLEQNGDDSPAAWAMQQLYQAACNTNTIHKIMQRFIAICPRDRFINTINRFGQTAFSYNTKDCLELVADSIDESGIDKTQFIVDCITTRGPNTSRHGGGVTLEAAFWDAPLLKTEEERALVTKAMVERLGVEFLGLFTSYQQYHKPMIKSLHATDPVYCEILFTSMLTELTHVNNDSFTKIHIFIYLCMAYEIAGVDLFTLLHGDSCKPLTPIITNWYLEHGRKVVNERTLTWQLLKTYSPDQLFFVALEMIKKQAIGDDHQVRFYSFNRLLETFEKLGSLEALLAMIREDSAILESIKKACLEDVTGVFDGYGRNHCLPIILQLVPDLTTRLATWAKTQVIKCRDKALSFGGKASYYNVESVFKNLTTNDLLEQVLAEIASQDPDGNLKKDLEHIMENLKKSKAV